MNKNLEVKNGLFLGISKKNMTVLKEILITIVVLLILDSMFLFTMGPFFKRQVFAVQGSPLTLNYVGASIAYFFMVVGLYWLIIRKRASVFDAFILGLVIYGVYEGTTKALLDRWEYKTMIIDTAWGGTVMSLSTFIIYKILNHY